MEMVELTPLSRQLLPLILYKLKQSHDELCSAMDSVHWLDYVDEPGPFDKTLTDEWYDKMEYVRSEINELLRVGEMIQELDTYKQRSV